MGNSHDWTSSRLGPYHLDRCYRDINEPGGQLYAAHNVDTGRPALVLVPGPGDTWAPRSDWSAHVTSQASPPFLATELEHPPPAKASALSDLDLGFIRLAGAVACVEDRADANAAFTQPPRHQPSQHRPGWLSRGLSVRTGALIAGALVLAAVVLWTLPPASPQRVADVAEAVRTEPTTLLWINNQSGPSAIGYPMPDTAFAIQMTPPCKGSQVELRGGCWMLLKQTAPCDKDTAEYKGECYMPVHKEKPEPRSVKP